MSLSQFRKDLRVQAAPSTDCWMRGDRYGTVTTVGRKYVHAKMDVSGKVRKFTPDLLEPVRTPEPPAHCVGRKCWYLAPNGRKIAAVVDSLDHERHPTRLNVRVTVSDPQYPEGKLINTPPAFVQPR